MKTFFNIAVVGHTNTGKTSFIRALTQDQNFGEVKNAPSTTLDVAKISLKSDDIAFNFFDTPGFEDALGVLEALPMKTVTTTKAEEKEHLINFLNKEAHHLDYEQEIKVLKQTLKSDIIFLIIDIRQPLLPKYRYEIELLLKTQLPILPILNFTHYDGYMNEWKNELRSHGLHNYLEYDSIVLPQKQRLFEKLIYFFPDDETSITNFINLLKTQDLAKQNRAYVLLSCFLVNLLTLQIEAEKESSTQDIEFKFQQKLKPIEDKLLNDLLDIYQFSLRDVHYLNETISHHYETAEFLSTDEMITFSMEFGKGAATGAGLFASVDLVSGFSTLGVATLSGALIGGTLNSLNHYKTKILNAFNQIDSFLMTDKLVSILLERYLFLFNQLTDRSHASLLPINLTDKNTQNETNNYAKLIEKYRYLRAEPQLFNNPSHPKFIKVAKLIENDLKN